MRRTAVIGVIAALLATLLLVLGGCGDSGEASGGAGNGGSGGAGGFGGSGGEGGAGGFGGLEEGQCWIDDDCFVDAWCFPAVYQGDPADMPGTCRVPHDSGIVFIRELAVVDAQSEPLPGVYEVDFRIEYPNNDSAITSLSAQLEDPFTTDGTVLSGGWSFSGAALFGFDTMVDGVAVTCTLIVDGDGVSGVEILDGYSHAGTLRCPGDGAHFVVRFEVLEP